MRSKFRALSVPCSLLLALAIVHLANAQKCQTYVLAAMLPVAAVLVDRPSRFLRRAHSRLALCLLFVLLLSPPELRRTLCTTPLGSTFVVLVTCLSGATIVTSLAVALAEPAVPRWLRLFAIQSDTVSAMARAECRLAWFAIIRWRRSPSDCPPGALTFEANKTGTDVAMAWVAAASGLIEGPLLHLLLRHFSPTAAWTATGLTIVTSIYFAGFAKSLALRPTLLFQDRLVIRLGALASRSLPRAEIHQTRLLQGPTPRTGVIRLFAFEKPNIEVSAAGKNYLFRVDQPKLLAAELQAA